MAKASEDKVQNTSSKSTKQLVGLLVLVVIGMIGTICFAIGIIIFSSLRTSDSTGPDLGQKVVGECVITGCSGEICSDEEMVSDCAWREEYICYKGANCERQPDGQCGWTETTELRACLGANQFLP